MEAENHRPWLTPPGVSQENLTSKKKLRKILNNLSSARRGLAVATSIRDVIAFYPTGQLLCIFHETAPTLPQDKFYNWDIRLDWTRVLSKNLSKELSVANRRKRQIRTNRFRSTKICNCCNGARSRGRTGTEVTLRGILSPLRLPISPSGHGGDGQRHSGSICINAFAVPGE